MKNKLFSISAIAIILAILAPMTFANNETMQATAVTPTIGMANPASVNCAKLGGTASIQKDTNGGEYSNCKLPNGTICEEWALFRGECGKSTLSPQATKIVSDFSAKLDSTFKTDTAKKNATIDKAIAKLKALKETKPNLTSLISDVMSGLSTLRIMK